MSDFRVAVAQKSQAFSPGGFDYDGVNHSLCLPNPPSRIFWHTARVTTAACLLSSAVALITGLFITISGIWDDPVIVGIGYALPFAGIVFSLSATLQYRWMVRAALGGLLRRLKSRFGDDLQFVNVEDFTTWQRTKVVPEDAGFLAIDRNRGVLFIEGVGFRYVIQASDLHTLEVVRTKNSTGVHLGAHVHGEDLHFVLQTLSLREQFTKVFGSSKDPALYEFIVTRMSWDPRPKPPPLPAREPPPLPYA